MALEITTPWTERLTSAYARLLEDTRQPPTYRDCIRHTIEGALRADAKAVCSIALIGGLARESSAIPNWSDVDLLIVYWNITSRDPRRLAALVNGAETRYGLRLDVTEISAPELCDPTLSTFCCSGELMNAVSGREGSAQVLFGELPESNFTQRQEKQAALVYIVQTQALFRRYLIEVRFRTGEPRRDLQRMTRWTFSILRASLRLFDHFVHPYAASLPFLRQLFPQVDCAVLDELIQLRLTGRCSSDWETLTDRIVAFIETYIPLVFEKLAHDQIKP